MPVDDSRRKDLSVYRMDNAFETLNVSAECIEGCHYKDAVNRSYYAAFYAVKAVLALEGQDFKRHKDVVSYFNHHYVASGIFSKDIGRKLARLQQKREHSDYDDFYIASKQEAEEQLSNAKDIVNAISRFLEVDEK